MRLNAIRFKNYLSRSHNKPAVFRLTRQPCEGLGVSGV